MTQNFSHLFSPLKVNQTEIRNRLVMGSMHTGLEDSDEGMRKLIEFYRLRARGGVGLIVTGGFAPNRRGWLVPFSGKLTTRSELPLHMELTKTVQAEGSKILLQILHAGRYSYHPFLQAPSALKAAISPFKPWQMSERQIKATIQDFVNSAVLAQQAGYDGVEIMGSEGYLLNQFIAKRTNHRQDEWGGSFENRIRFAREIVRLVRQRTGPNFLIMFRISILDLVPEGSTFQETVVLARELENDGVSIFNSGIGWHEARVPTIATNVPRATFVDFTARLKQHVRIPVVAVNRINTPELAEEILSQGKADLISMARPLLADPEFANKSRQGKSHLINTCIACNQGCLDLIFQKQRATCLVNPRAGYETEMPVQPAQQAKKIAVVGAGPAGLSFAVTAASRGHQVFLYEKAPRVGGQFNLAKKIPGKGEFYETLRYYENQLNELKVKLFLNSEATVDSLQNEKAYDEVVVATGTRPRWIQLEQETAASTPKLVSYVDILEGKVAVADQVAIIGAGGIGFDVAKFVLACQQNRDLRPSEGPQCSHSQTLHQQSKDEFFTTWGVSLSPEAVGGLASSSGVLPPEGKNRKIIMMQRKTGRPGKNLGKTTGWIHRAELQKGQVEMLSGVEYLKLSAQGLHIRHRDKDRVLVVQQVIVCAGQESERELYQRLKALPAVHLIGGAEQAGELDARRAILQGAKLGLSI